MYSFTVNNLKASDNLTMSHLHPGAPGVNGPAILTLAMPITGNSASGTVSNVRQSLVDSLKGGTEKSILMFIRAMFPQGWLGDNYNSYSKIFRIKNGCRFWQPFSINNSI